MNLPSYFVYNHRRTFIPQKMTKLFSKLNLTKLFYIFPQQDQETIIPPEIFQNHSYSQPNAQAYQG